MDEEFQAPRLCSGEPRSVEELPPEIDYLTLPVTVLSVTGSAVTCRYGLDAAGSPLTLEVDWSKNSDVVRSCPTTVKGDPTTPPQHGARGLAYLSTTKLGAVPPEYVLKIKDPRTGDPTPPTFPVECRLLSLIATIEASNGDAVWEIGRFNLLDPRWADLDGSTLKSGDQLSNILLTKDAILEMGLPPPKAMVDAAKALIAKHRKSERVGLATAEALARAYAIVAAGLRHNTKKKQPPKKAKKAKKS